MNIATCMSYLRRLPFESRSHRDHLLPRESLGQGRISTHVLNDDWLVGSDGLPRGPLRLIVQQCGKRLTPDTISLPLATVWKRHSLQ
jgi:hypothetical protein